jgi:hypothetical protein
MVNLVSSSGDLVDQVIHLVQSSVEPVDHVISLISTWIDPTLPLESEVKVVDIIPPLVNPTPPLKSEDVAQVFPFSTDSFGLGGTSPVPMEPPPSNEAIILDWGALQEYCLPSYTPIQITVHVCVRDIPQIIIDEGASISILSSISWKALGSPMLAPVTYNLLDFNRKVTQPLGILPQFPITLGGKNVLIDVMVVHDPLDFNLLLGKDYVYAMKFFVPTIFHLMCFPHNGNMVTIEHISFIEPRMMVNHLTSLNNTYILVTPASLQVNYVATCPMCSTLNEKESLPYFHLDPVVYMVISLIGLLEVDLPTPIVALNMYSSRV